ncbi:uncharacterized protein C8Q71DRAFT_726678 [Rhodofomes roseus]|uniref:Uncharacterized protein n=2 Tax=Rhodofomes roseus TaxID=34475 RepID=A0ABQ8K4K0_9APHY|nr:uncharacterized protein C8Q71DRAFT_726678 [Rhodofomes roseus]KAH9831818.1 hypothetical protein C8Q71DRAFT_726678 [Rhodofomes roseus]
MASQTRPRRDGRSVYHELTPLAFADCGMDEIDFSTEAADAPPEAIAHVSGTEVLDITHSDLQQRERSGIELPAGTPPVMIVFSPPMPFSPRLQSRDALRSYLYMCHVPFRPALHAALVIILGIVPPELRSLSVGGAFRAGLGSAGSEYATPLDTDYVLVRPLSELTLHDVVERLKKLHGLCTVDEGSTLLRLNRSSDAHQTVQAIFSRLLPNMTSMELTTLGPATLRGTDEEPYDEADAHDFISVFHSIICCRIFDSVPRVGDLDHGVLQVHFYPDLGCEDFRLYPHRATFCNDICIKYYSRATERKLSKPEGMTICTRAQRDAKIDMAEPQRPMRPASDYLTLRGQPVDEEPASGEARQKRVRPAKQSDIHMLTTDIDDMQRGLSSNHRVNLVYPQYSFLTFNREAL